MEFYGLLKRLSPKIRAIAYKLKGHFGSFNEQDLFQEAVIYLWQECKNDRLFDKTDSYILQGCYFYLKNYIRTHKSKVGMVSIDAQIDEEDTLFEEIFLKDEDSLYFRDYLDDKLIADIISNSVANPKEKQMLTYYSEGLTTREIGKKLGVSHVSVIKMTNKIKKKSKKFKE